MEADCESSQQRPKTNVRIFLHDYSGHPPQVYLSRELARRSHEVCHAYSADFLTPHGALHARRDDPDSFSLKRIALNRPFRKHSYFIRQIQEIQYGLQLRSEAIRFKPDVVICSNTPLAALQILQDECRRRGIPFVFWLMDLYGIAIHSILRRKIPLLGEIVGRFYIWLEERQLRKSDKVVLISEGFRCALDRWGIRRDRVEVMPLWAPLEELPLRPKANPWSIRHGLENSTNIIYSGTLGMKHNPAALVELARRYRDHPDVRLIVISEGLGADYLMREKTARQLSNLLLLPFQDYDEFPSVLGAADILLTLLEPDAGVFSVPSKVLTYLCAGKAQVGALPAENRAAKVIAVSGCGLTVSPLDVAGFVRAVEELVNDSRRREDMGRSARTYAEQEFDIRRIGNEFERYLFSVCAAPRNASLPTSRASATSPTVDAEL
jgi:colanic acid biosynthesis glycosyl transferase WcaI